MEKSHTGRYPEIKVEQFDFRNACMALLNCRRYLESEGFKGLTGEHFSNLTARMHLPGDIVIFEVGAFWDLPDPFESMKSDKINSLLEKAVLEGVFLEIDDDYDRKEVVKSTYRKEDFQVLLKVIDTTREKAGFPKILYDALGFINLPEIYSLEYIICLNKSVIADSDLRSFEKYQRGLEGAVKQLTLVNYKIKTPTESESTQTQQPIQAQQPAPQKYDIPDPWKVKTEEIEDKRYGGRR